MFERRQTIEEPWEGAWADQLMPNWNSSTMPVATLMAKIKPMIPTAKRANRAM